MGLCSDRWITRMARDHGMIEPFEDRQVREGVISYGVSSYGYDMRVAREFKIFTNVLSSVVDPKSFDPKSFVEFEGDVCIVPPNSFALASSVEYFRIPRNVLTLTVGKSTYARCRIITNVTPFEPEWEGFVTLEISNTTPLPARIYANEGIAQVVFFTGNRLDFASEVLSVTTLSFLKPKFLDIRILSWIKFIERTRTSAAFSPAGRALMRFVSSSNWLLTLQL